jgi:hypothetical protein
VAAHLDRARISNTLQPRALKCFRELGVHHDRGRCGRRRNGHRDHAAAGRSVPLVYVQSGIDIVVVMDSRTVPMIAVVVRVSDRVHVESEALRL